VEEVDRVRDETEEALKKYVDLARGMGIPSDHKMSMGTEAVSECERLAAEVAREYERSIFFAGKLIFEREKWWDRLLHNETRTRSSGACSSRACRWSFSRCACSRSRMPPTMDPGPEPPLPPERERGFRRVRRAVLGGRRTSRIRISSTRSPWLRSSPGSASAPTGCPPAPTDPRRHSRTSATTSTSRSSSRR